MAELPQRAADDDGPTLARPLARWELAFASWWAAHSDRRISMREQEKIATALKGESVGYGALKRLKQHPRFTEYCEALQRGAVSEARAKFVSDLPTYVEHHMWAAERARAKDDPRGVIQATAPALDRVLPKRDVPTQATQVVIQLTERQRDGLRNYRDAEVLPAELLEPGDTDNERST